MWTSRWMRRLLVRLLALWSRLGAQPHRDVNWLHRVPHHPYQLGVQRIQIRLVPEPGRKRFQSLHCVIFPSVEAPINDALDATPQRVEQCRYQESGNDYRESRPLPAECPEDRLRRRHAPEVPQHQQGSKRAVDESSVYDEVYVIEPIA